MHADQREAILCSKETVEFNEDIGGVGRSWVHGYFVKDAVGDEEHEQGKCCGFGGEVFDCVECSHAREVIDDDVYCYIALQIRRCNC